MKNRYDDGSMRKFKSPFIPFNLDNLVSVRMYTLCGNMIICFHNPAKPEPKLNPLHFLHFLRRNILSRSLRNRRGKGHDCRLRPASTGEEVK